MTFNLSLLGVETPPSQKEHGLQMVAMYPRRSMVAHFYRRLMTGGF